MCQQSHPHVLDHKVNTASFKGESVVGAHAQEFVHRLGPDPDFFDHLILTTKPSHSSIFLLPTTSSCHHVHIHFSRNYRHRRPYRHRLDRPVQRLRHPCRTRHYRPPTPGRHLRPQTQHPHLLQPAPAVEARLLPGWTHMAHVPHAQEPSHAFADGSWGAQILEGLGPGVLGN